MMLELSRERVLLFVTPTADVEKSGLLSEYRSQLRPEEIQKADAYRFPKDQCLSLTARAQLRYALSLCLGRAARDFEFSANAYGKPCICPGTVGDNLQFNLSHTKGMVITAVALEKRVGVDIERMDRELDLDIAKRFFTGPETAQILALPEQEQQKKFLDFWTLKEAFIKAMGKGLSIPLHTIGFDLRDPLGIVFSLSDPSLSSLWRFFAFSPAPGTRAAMAVNTDGDIEVGLYSCIPFHSYSPLDCKLISNF